MVKRTMKEDFRYGQGKKVSYVLLDQLCIILANVIALWLYNEITEVEVKFSEHIPALIMMMVIDFVVILLFHTNRNALRRRMRRELYIDFIHVAAAFLILSTLLFLTKQGREYSRTIVVLSYAIDFILLVITHLFWRSLLREISRKGEKPTALLMSTDGFVEEGIKELEKIGIDIKAILLLLNLKKEDTISGIPIVKNEKEAASFICWNDVDRVYIYGIEKQMLSEALRKFCSDMGIKIDVIDFKYRVLNVKTVQNPDRKYGNLTFLEEKRDIPFSIRRVYWITETDASLHRGFHAHKQNCQLLFCPYGRIDIILDDGEEKTTVTLDGPEKGLLLMPGLWREMVWKESGSVLCVLASEFYDESEYIRNYDEFIAYQKEK